MTNNVKRLTLSAFFLALGLILPIAFHSIGPSGGAFFLPMHIPVLLCGFICGPSYGALVGLITPLLSSAITGMPVLMPTGIAMMLELMTYGFLSGLLIQKKNVYVSLLFTMFVGRIVSGVANLVLLSYLGKAYTLAIFLSAAFVSALPGIILQILIIPLLLNVVKKIEHKHQVD
ncbi:MAG: ECF transporter S component [Longicatena sp.]